MLENVKSKINKIFKNSYNFYTAYAIISFTIIMIVACIIGIVGRSNSIKSTKAEMESVTMSISDKVNEKISHYAGNIKKITTWFNQIGNPELDFTISRKQASIVLSENISQEPEMKYLFSVWEPQMFDGKDSIYALKEYHDSTGRFIPEFRKNNDGIIEQDYVKNYNDKDDINSYYYFKTRTGLTFSEPRLIRENAKNVLLLPVTIPLKFGTRLLGVLGAEFNISSLSNELSDLEIPKYYGIVVFSHSGKIIAATEKKLLIGREVNTVFPNNTDFFFLKFRRGDNFEIYQDNDYIINRDLKLEEYNTHFDICVIIDKDALTHNGNIFLVKSLGIGLLIFILLTILVIFFRNYYTSQIEILTHKGEIMTDVDKEYIKKTGLYIPELQNLDNIMLKYHQTFVKIRDLNKEIEQHSYNDTLDTLPRENKFQQSYNKMLETLREIASSENNRKENETRENWIKQGVALINESMRIGTNQVDLLCDNILLTLIKYSDAVLGGIYINSNEDDGQYLQLVSSVALGKKKALKIKVQKGVGIVGTCALEKSMITLNNLPDNYVNVISGLGKSKPKTLVVTPLLYDGELIAVIEIAFLRSLKDYETKFLEIMSSTVASALVTARINAKTEQLMKQFRAQADTLVENEKLMSENIRTLKAEQQKSREREADMKSLIDAVNNTILTIEYTTEGVLLTANDKYLKNMHYELSEIQGVNVLDLVKTEREELKNVIHNVSTTGQYYEKEMKRFTKSGEVRWLWSTYTPYYNYEGKITKILYFAIDITETKQHQEMLENKIKELEELSQKLQNENKQLQDKKE
ncbi:MAG: PAS domain S-box protein [Bacteroidales bacterium]|nr:PAS domain S-box protein [Bacteroidales bacterium]